MTFVSQFLSGPKWMVVTFADILWHSCLSILDIYDATHSLVTSELAVSAATAKSVLITELRPGYKCLSARG